MGEKTYIEELFSLTVKMINEELVKIVCLSESDYLSRKERPHGIWKNRVKENIHEKGTDKQGKV